MKDLKQLRIRFILLQAIFWCACCTFASYAAAYFLRAGLGSSQCTLILLSGMAASFAGQFLLGSICARRGKNREVFVLCGLGSSVTAAAMCFFLQAGIPAACCLYPLLCLTQAPMAAILDSWEMAVLSDDGAVLGLSRGMAAAAYAVFHFFYAEAVEYSDYRVIPMADLILYGITLALSLSLPSSLRARDKMKKAKLSAGKKLSHIPAFVTLLPVLFFLGIAATPNNTLKILLYRSVGKDVGFLGVDSLFCSGVQTVLFPAAGKLSGKKPSASLAWCAAALTGACLLLCRAESAEAVLAANTLIAAVYPFILLSIRNISVRDIPAQMRTAANAAADAVYGSIAGMTGMVYAGAVLEQSGIRTLLLISLSEYACAAVLAWLRAWYLKKRKESCCLQETCEKT